MDRLLSMWFLTIFLAVNLTAMKKAQNGGNIPIRRLQGLDAIQEAVGRATEMGRTSLFIIPGGPFDAQAFAAFDLLGYVASQTAKYDTKLLVVNALAEAHAISEDIVTQAYKAQNKEESLDNASLRFLASGFTAGVLGIYERHEIGANFLFGSFYFESLTLAEAGQRTGAIQVSGTANTHQIPFLVAACDYSLIGEEIYAAGTYLSGNPAQIGSLVAQELGKYVGIVLIAALSIWRTASVLFKS